MIQALDWFINVLVPSVFAKLNGWQLVSGVSVLGIIAAGFVIWFFYRRFV